MAEKVNFPFVQKEGKYFSPIVSMEPKYIVQNGAVVQDGDKIVSGIKGVFAKVRLSINSEEEAQLFAINTEMFQSSK